MTFLVLFDVDGTLLLTPDEVYVEANRDALLDVYGVAPAGTDQPGETVTSHTRRALRSAGLTDTEIDKRLARWCATFSARYLELLPRRNTTGWRGAPDAARTLGQIQHRALLTGNPEPVARARMRRLGLAGFFPQGQGAYGCEREQRLELFQLARERSGGWPAEQTVAVGDTPRDIDTAHADGARCVAVATGSYTREQLSAAEVVIDRLAELPDVLAQLS